jgi:hypothetical protein
MSLDPWDLPTHMDDGSDSDSEASQAGGAFEDEWLLRFDQSGGGVAKWKDPYVLYSIKEFASTEDAILRSKAHGGENTEADAFLRRPILLTTKPLKDIVLSEAQKQAKQAKGMGVLTEPSFASLVEVKEPLAGMGPYACLKYFMEMNEGNRNPAIDKYLVTEEEKVPQAGGAVGSIANKCYVKDGQTRCGLPNANNRCYFNTFLQMIYSIEPVREAINNFNPDAHMGQTTIISDISGISWWKSLLPIKNTVVEKDKVLQDIEIARMNLLISTFQFIFRNYIETPQDKRNCEKMQRDIRAILERLSGTIAPHVPDESYPEKTILHFYKTIQTNIESTVKILDEDCHHVDKTKPHNYEPMLQHIYDFLVPNIALPNDDPRKLQKDQSELFNIFFKEMCRYLNISNLFASYLTTSLLCGPTQFSTPKKDLVVPIIIDINLNDKQKTIEDYIQKQQSATSEDILAGCLPDEGQKKRIKDMRKETLTESINIVPIPNEKGDYNDEMIKRYVDTLSKDAFNLLNTILLTKSDDFITQEKITEIQEIIGKIKGSTATEEEKKTFIRFYRYIHEPFLITNDRNGFVTKTETFTVDTNTKYIFLFLKREKPNPRGGRPLLINTDIAISPIINIDGIAFQRMGGTYYSGLHYIYDQYDEHGNPEVRFNDETVTTVNEKEFPDNQRKTLILYKKVEGSGAPPPTPPASQAQPPPTPPAPKASEPLFHVYRIINGVPELFDMNSVVSTIKETYNSDGTMNSKLMDGNK